MHAILILLLSAFYMSYIHAMEKTDSVEDYYLVRDASNRALTKDTRYKQQVLKAKKYNQEQCALIRFRDILSHLCVPNKDQVCSLRQTLYMYMKLRMTSSHFNTLLTHEAVGNFCADYRQNIKRKAVTFFIISCKDSSYYKIRTLLMLLAHARAPIEPRLLEIAAVNGDEEFLRILFNHHAQPNMTYCGRPIFFELKTIPLITLFIEHGLDIHVHDDKGLNVLWSVISQGYPPEIMEKYLTFEVDPRQVDAKGRNLLHRLVNQDYYEGFDNLLKKAKLLLAAIPDMINSVDLGFRTPLDYAEQVINIFRHYKDKTSEYQKIVDLYTTHEIQYNRLEKI
jgi:hypothetical protein